MCIRDSLLVGHCVGTDGRERLVVPWTTADHEIDRVARRVPIEVEGGAGDAVGHGRHHLQADPTPGEARQPERMHAEVDDVLLVAGVEHRYGGVRRGPDLSLIHI